MITLFVLGMILFVGKLVYVAFKATWGIVKGVLFVIGLPGLLIALFVIGLTYFAIPLLILALLAVFIWPVLKGI